MIAVVKAVGYALGLLLIGAGLVLMVVYGVFARFAHPDMTEMRLLFTYWPQYALSIVCLFGGCALTTLGEER